VCVCVGEIPHVPINVTADQAASSVETKPQGKQFLAQRNKYIRIELGTFLTQIHEHAYARAFTHTHTHTNTHTYTHTNTHTHTYTHTHMHTQTHTHTYTQTHTHTHMCRPSNHTL